DYKIAGVVMGVWGVDDKFILVESKNGFIKDQKTCLEIMTFGGGIIKFTGRDIENENENDSENENSSNYLAVKPNSLFKIKLSSSKAQGVEKFNLVRYVRYV
ncbi:MAG: hypothetical protein HQK53_17015, partial [Oligoflexia bacterium]|nr:hypothetical protein [Oligoflexia bacterium]